MARPESAPALGAALVPGSAVVLVPGWVGAMGSRDWLDSCGKTQLAVSFAESLWHTRDVDLLVWVVATSRASVLSGYAEAAVTAMGTELSGDAESVAARFLSWLGGTSRPWLVVLGDLSHAADLDGLWPGGPGGMVLITTADSATISTEHQARVLPVGAFSTREALTYLTGRLHADPGQRIGEVDLVEGLGCEPLALAQASSVIASSGQTCRDYLENFAQRREQMAEPPAAAITWTFCVEQADRLSPGGDAQSMLALAELLDGHGIPGAVFTTSATLEYLADDNGGDPADPERPWRALVTLAGAGLLSVDRAATPPVVRMSPVVQAAARAAMPDGAMHRAVRAAASALLEVWPADDRQPWLATDLRSCAASLQEAAGDLLWAEDSRPLLFRAGRSLDLARLTGPAVVYWRELAAVGERVLGPGHPDTVLADQRLADAYLAAGRAAEAVSWFQWVLTDRARTLGPYHPGTIAVQRNLGRASMAADQLADAIIILGAAAASYERVRGADHLDTLSVREDLAAAHRAAGQFPEAIRLYQRTLADRERLQEPQHPDTLSTREKLAEAYLADGRIKDALPAYKRTLADRERILGPDHLDTIAVRGNLAAAYHAAGRMASAIQLYEQTCEAYQRVLGADHPDALARRASLAHAYDAVGRLTDATSLLRDTLARCERVLPPGDPLTQAMRKRLANIAGR